MNSEDTAALARLLRGARLAHLGTLREGAPLVSMTLFLAAPGFDAFHLHVSRLAWHTQDMAADARVALSIAETDDGRQDPFTLARVTIRGAAAQIAGDAALERAWLARFPAQAVNFTLGDFAFWRLAPRDARFVAGYGRIHSLSAEELAAASRA
jgi:putative heme iron utilization protein